MTRLIGPPLGSGSGEGTASPPRQTLPDDLLRAASRRLGIMALLGAGIWFIASLLGHLASGAMDPGNPAWRQFQGQDLVALLNIAVSLGLYLYSRGSRKHPGFLLDLGLVYLVFTSLGIAIVNHYGGPPPGWVATPEVSWVGATILMFAAIIPNPPLKTLLASLIAVSMNPLGMWLVYTLGLVEGDAARPSGLLMHYPDYILVGVAVVISHVWTRMGQQVTRARELGSYHVGELLGQGGMGVVYRATHRMLARSAAIKFIRPEILAGGNPEMVELAITRFTREAEVAASLQSPHTVVLYDFGVAEDESLYYVMELLEGLNVQQLVEQHGPLPPGRAVFILRQVCESLEEAHGHGLVHRDVTPANIHIGRMGVSYDFAKVLDFGLAKSVRSNGEGRHPETAAGVIPGTPDYMAPEMTQGKPVDGRADVYALGCVGYYMLTGRQVFEAANVFHMIARHLNDEPVPPSQVAPQHIPDALDQLILACLAKEPGDRPQSAAMLSKALAAVPTDPWTEEEALKWWSTR